MKFIPRSSATRTERIASSRSTERNSWPERRRAEAQPGQFQAGPAERSGLHGGRQVGRVGWLSPVSGAHPSGSARPMHRYGVLAAEKQMLVESIRPTHRRFIAGQLGSA